MGNGSIDDLSADVDHAIRLNADLEYFRGPDAQDPAKGWSIGAVPLQPRAARTAPALEEQKAKTGRCARSC